MTSTEGLQQDLKRGWEAAQDLRRAWLGEFAIFLAGLTDSAQISDVNQEARFQVVRNDITEHIGRVVSKVSMNSADGAPLSYSQLLAYRANPNNAAVRPAAVFVDNFSIDDPADSISCQRFAAEVLSVEGYFDDRDITQEDVDVAAHVNIGLRALTSDLIRTAVPSWTLANNAASAQE